MAVAEHMRLILLLTLTRMRQGLTARFCMLPYYPILLTKDIERDSETCNAPMWYIRGLIDGGTFGTYVIIWIFRAIL